MPCMYVYALLGCTHTSLCLWDSLPYMAFVCACGVAQVCGRDYPSFFSDLRAAFLALTRGDKDSIFSLLRPPPPQAAVLAFRPTEPGRARTKYMFSVMSLNSKPFDFANQFEPTDSLLVQVARWLEACIEAVESSSAKTAQKPLQVLRRGEAPSPLVDDDQQGAFEFITDRFLKATRYVMWRTCVASMRALWSRMTCCQRTTELVCSVARSRASWRDRNKNVSVACGYVCVCVRVQVGDSRLGVNLGLRRVLGDKVTRDTAAHRPRDRARHNVTCSLGHEATGRSRQHNTQASGHEPESQPERTRAAETHAAGIQAG